MIYVINNSDDPFFNHAAEEYLMDNFNDEIFMLWINRPAILIGRNQNTMSEINYEYAKENDITVVRRLSGGGTVYNDYGNMLYTFITYRGDNEGQVKNGFEKFAAPVIDALQSLGVNAIFTGRNDITIEDKKFSGNAQYFTKEKLLHHGTLLYDCDMSKLSLALKSKPIKFVDKAVKSVGSRVTNIADHMNKKMSLSEFRDYLKDYVIKVHGIENIYEFSSEDIVKINEIADKRFRTWEWNYGKSPEYQFQYSAKYKSGVVEYNVNVEDGLIKAISLNGDFFGEKDIHDIEEKLVGIRYDMEDIELALKDVSIDPYIKGLEKVQLIEGIMNIERTDDLGRN